MDFILLALLHLFSNRVFDEALPNRETRPTAPLPLQRRFYPTPLANLLRPVDFQAARFFWHRRIAGRLRMRFRSSATKFAGHARWFLYPRRDVVSPRLRPSCFWCLPSFYIVSMRRIRSGFLSARPCISSYSPSLESTPRSFRSPLEEALFGASSVPRPSPSLALRFCELSSVDGCFSMISFRRASSSVPGPCSSEGSTPSTPRSSRLFTFDRSRGSAAGDPS